MKEIMDALQIIPRSFISLVILFLVTKWIGKKQVSELSLFDYVIGISIGNFAAEMTINMDAPFIHGILAVFVFGLVAYLVSKFTMKSIILRRVLIGTPTIVVDKGKILIDNLRKTKYDIHDFLEQCRVSGTFDVSEIEYAIVEANGKLSILPKAENKPVTPKDMKLKVNPSVLVANVMVDGKMMDHALEAMHKTEPWLKQELKIKGYQTYENILLVTLDHNEKITVYEKNEKKEAPDILE